MYRDGDVAAAARRRGEAAAREPWGVEPAEEEKEDDEEEDAEEAAAANRTEYAEVAEAMAEAGGAQSGKIPLLSRINQQTYSRMLQTRRGADVAAAVVGSLPHVLVLHGEGESCSPRDER